MAETLANHIAWLVRGVSTAHLWVGGNAWRVGWWCGGKDILLGPERTTRPPVSGFSCWRGVPPFVEGLLFLAGAIFHQTAFGTRLCSGDVGGGCGWWVACCLRIAQWMRASLWSSL